MVNLIQWPFNFGLWCKRQKDCHRLSSKEEATSVKGQTDKMSKVITISESNAMNCILPNKQWIGIGLFWLQSSKDKLCKKSYRIKQIIIQWSD